MPEHLPFPPSLPGTIAVPTAVGLLLPGGPASGTGQAARGSAVVPTPGSGCSSVVLPWGA